MDLPALAHTMTAFVAFHRPAGRAQSDEISLAGKPSAEMLTKVVPLISSSPLLHGGLGEAFCRR